jgi:hypothetical protein
MTYNIKEKYDAFCDFDLKGLTYDLITFSNKIKEEHDGYKKINSTFYNFLESEYFDYEVLINFFNEIHKNIDTSKKVSFFYYINKKLHQELCKGLEKTTDEPFSYAFFDYLIENKKSKLLSQFMRGNVVNTYDYPVAFYKINFLTKLYVKHGYNDLVKLKKLIMSPYETDIRNRFIYIKDLENLKVFENSLKKLNVKNLTEVLDFVQFDSKEAFEHGFDLIGPVLTELTKSDSVNYHDIRELLIDFFEFHMHLIDENFIYNNLNILNEIKNRFNVDMASNYSNFFFPSLEFVELCLESEKDSYPLNHIKNTIYKTTSKSFIQNFNNLKRIESYVLDDIVSGAWADETGVEGLLKLNNGFYKIHQKYRLLKFEITRDLLKCFEMEKDIDVRRKLRYMFHLSFMDITAIKHLFNSSLDSTLSVHDKIQCMGKTLYFIVDYYGVTGKLLIRNYSEANTLFYALEKKYCFSDLIIPILKLIRIWDTEKNNLKSSNNFEGLVNLSDKFNKVSLLNWKIEETSRRYELMDSYNCYGLDQLKNLIENRRKEITYKLASKFKST